MARTGQSVPVEVSYTCTKGGNLVHLTCYTPSISTSLAQNVVTYNCPEGLLLSSDQKSCDITPNYTPNQTTQYPASGRNNFTCQYPYKTSAGVSNCYPATYAATASYQCKSGDASSKDSSATCISKTSQVAYQATITGYTCPSAGVLVTATCYTPSTASAPAKNQIIYYCPFGGVLSGTLCKKE